MKFYILNTKGNVVFISALKYDTVDEAKSIGDKFLIVSQMSGYKSWVKVEIRPAS